MAPSRLELTDFPVSLLLPNKCVLPEGTEVIGDRTVRNDKYPHGAGAVLVRFQSGRYALFLAGAVSPCDQVQAKKIHQMFLKENKTERLHIRITPELKEQLQAAADAENRTITNYVENLIKQALKKQGNA